MRHDLTYDEIEVNVLRQSVRISKGFDTQYKTRKYETIFSLRDKMITVEKAGSKKWTYILTLWESSEKEVDLWKKGK